LNRDYLALIPARTGSKGIPNKNFRLLADKPVIEYSINHASRLADLCDLVISTDNLEFLHNYVIQSHGIDPSDLDFSVGVVELTNGIHIHPRSKELSTDTTPIALVISEILSRLEEAGKKYKGVVILQPTAPFRSQSDLRAIRDFLENEANLGNVFISFTRVQDSHPARMYSRLESGDFSGLGLFSDLRFNRRQDLPDIYLRDGCYYYFGSDVLKLGLNSPGGQKGIVREFPWTVNLDGQADWILARGVLEGLNEETLTDRAF
jgi:CMP-N-acetylneuraminic acid synthetase